MKNDEKINRFKTENKYVCVQRKNLAYPKQRAQDEQFDDGLPASDRTNAFPAFFPVRRGQEAHRNGGNHIRDAV